MGCFLLVVLISQLINNFGNQIEIILYRRGDGLEYRPLINFCNGVGAQARSRIQWICHGFDICGVNRLQLINHTENFCDALGYLADLLPVNANPGQLGDFVDFVLFYCHVTIYSMLIALIGTPD